MGYIEGSRLNIKMPPGQYRNSYPTYNTVSRSPYLYNGNSLPGITMLLFKRGPESTN